MSSEGENAKDLSTEADKESVDNMDDNSSEDSQDKEVKSTVNDEEKSGEKNGAEQKVSSTKPQDAIEKKESEAKKEGKEEDLSKKDEDEKVENNESKTDNDTEEGDDSGKEDGSSSSKKDGNSSGKKEDKKGVPLLDQPLEQSGTRERKKVQRFTEDNAGSDGKEGKTEIPSGLGVQLGEIPRIDASISRFKNDDLKLLHRLLYKTLGKTTLIKKNIKKFNGFDFKKDTEDYTTKIEFAKKFELKQLKSICEMLDLEKKGAKDEIVQRVVEFLMEPKDSGKAVGGGRPKRTAAVRANNRGYSSHDDSYSSDERRTSRGGRGKGRRTNLKDDTTSESDEEFHPSDASESKPRVVKRKRVGRKKMVSDDDLEENDEEEASDAESPTSEDSDEEPRKRKKTKKVGNNKAKGKTVPRTRGRKPAAESEKKPTPTKRANRKRNKDSSEDSDGKNEDNASSSEDEPLIKKAKSPQPPTDEEIKKYVKEILDGANLEEITMKTVCKQVYAHYPDFDLAHKKDFIKSTVKSLIST